MKEPEKKTRKAEMSWKKNVFSYLIWFIYTIAAGGILAAEAAFFCTEAGFAPYVGFLFAAIYLLLIGNIIFLLHRFAEKIFSFVHKNSGMLHVLEAALALILLAAGIILRIRGMESAGQSSAYYDAARVAAEQKIPQMVHGAVYLYVRMLHGVFLLMGNHFSAGLWVQLILQLGAFCLFFFMVRKVAGPVASLITLGFCTCSPYMVQSALILSPEILFLTIYIAAAYMIMIRKGRIRPELFFLWGILASFCIYVDVMGCWLLLTAVFVIFSNRWEAANPGRKTAAVVLCFLGAAAGFLAIVYVDAFLSEKAFGSVLQAWGMLYAPESFRLPFFGDTDTSGTGLESMILSGLMTFGIFSFWCDRKDERLCIWTIMAGTVAAAGCYGIFTDEMPGYSYLYLFLAVLAGTGVSQCFSGHAGRGEVPGERKDSQELPQEVEEEKEGSGFFGEKPEGEPEKVRKRLEERRESGTDMVVQKVQRTEKAGIQKDDKPEQRQIRYIDNPLPLPKKHMKRVLDYPVQTVMDKDDFDYPVSDEDDFDIV